MNDASTDKRVAAYKQFHIDLQDLPSAAWFVVREDPDEEFDSLCMDGDFSLDDLKKIVAALEKYKEAIA